MQVEQSIDGGVYSGQLKNGIPHGKGTMLRKDHRYTGCFVEGLPTGRESCTKTMEPPWRACFLPVWKPKGNILSLKTDTPTTTCLLRLVNNAKVQNVNSAFGEAFCTFAAFFKTYGKKYLF